jgi:phosphate transport system substrate-binding protein
MKKNTPKILTIIGVAALLASCSSKQETNINGAGATFPYPLYSKWFHDYTTVDPSARFNYQAIGSGAGQRQLLSGTVDFGASDVPMKDEQLAKAPGTILHIPTVAGSVVITYNLPGDPTLKLDGPTVTDIYLGKIKKWNDPRLVALNPGVNLPDQNILVVHRSDGSGTTGIFTAYLSAVSPEWKQKVGSDTSVNWPVGLGAKGNQGVSGLVKQSPGGLGYVELIYALQTKLPYAQLKNAEGHFITPSLESVSAAMATAKIPDDLRFLIVNGPGEKAYPIAGCTYLLVYKDLKKHVSDPVKAKKIVEFLNWAETDGQKMAAPLDYAPLPDSLRERALAKIKEIQD